MFADKSKPTPKASALSPIVFKLFRNNKGNAWFTIEVRADGVEEVRSMVASIEKWAISLLSVNTAPTKNSEGGKHV